MTTDIEPAKIQQTSEQPKILVVTMCTASRPVMLRRCMESILSQELPDNWVLILAVVENDSEPNCEVLVREIAENYSAKVVYEVEPEQGIPIARNRTLDMALRENADWIAFIDDDEYASPNWLEAFCLAAESYDAEMFRGTVLTNYPEGVAGWKKSERKAVSATGTPSELWATNNSMIQSKVVSKDGYNMRFDEVMRYTGGSDSDFFYRAKAKGLQVIDVQDAVVSEDLPANRTTLRWRFNRIARTFAHRPYIYSKFTPEYKVLFTSLFEIIKYTYKGILGLLISFICCFGYIYLAKRVFYLSICSFARAYGLIRGILGIQMNPYKTLDGS